MKTIHTDSAYPFIEDNGNPNGYVAAHGLTKRELFAKDFMSAILGNSAIYDTYDEYEIAEMAVHSTDVLIAELNKEVQS